MMRKHHPLIIFILSLLLSVIHAKQLCSEGVLSAKDLTSSSQLCCHADCGSCGDEGRHHFKCAKKYRLKDVCCPRFIKYSGKPCATAQDVGCVIEAEGAAKKDRAVAATTLPVAVTAAAAAVTEEKTSFTDKPHHPSSSSSSSSSPPPPPRPIPQRFGAGALFGAASDDDAPSLRATAKLKKPTTPVETADALTDDPTIEEEKNGVGAALVIALFLFAGLATILFQENGGITYLRLQYAGVPWRAYLRDRLGLSS
jgi:hypothetical protein